MKILLWDVSLCFAAVQCPAPLGLENGFVACNHETETRFSYQTSCGFSCDAGYHLVGPSRVTCTAAAEWSENMPRCEGKESLKSVKVFDESFHFTGALNAFIAPLAVTCHKPEAGAQMFIQCSGSELHPNSTCSFSCEPGFELQGANSVTCSEDGRWSEARPTCKGRSLFLSHYFIVLKEFCTFSKKKSFRVFFNVCALFLFCSCSVSGSPATRPWQAQLRRQYRNEVQLWKNLQLQLWRWLPPGGTDQGHLHSSSWVERADTPLWRWWSISEKSICL